MSLRTALLPVVDLVKSIADSTTLGGGLGLDVQTWTVKVRRRQWSSGKVRLGTPTDTTIQLRPRPDVKRSPDGMMMTVGPITPKYAGGGYEPADLNPPESQGWEFYYLVTGPDGVERPFKLTGINTDQPTEFFVTLAALDRRPPY